MAEINTSEFNESYLSNLISSKAEESTYLEFKRGEALEGSKNEIDKDISAFANSDGGILIYGIEEKDHVAESYSYIDGNIHTKEWLEQIINSRIKRQIPNLIIYPIRFDDDLTKTVYILKIPRSPIGPHMVNEGKYYKRSNFEVLRMQEYEVRDHYARVNSSALEIQDFTFKTLGVRRDGNYYREINFEFIFQIKNIGNTIEKDYKFEVTLPELPYSRGGNKRQYFIRNEGQYMVFSIPNSSPIFQNELTTIWSVNLQIQKTDFILLNTIGIRTKLYYTSGVVSRIFYPLETLKHEGNLIEKAYWI